MMGLFKKKSEPTVAQGIIAYEKICGADKEVLRSRLKDTLVNAQYALNFSQIADESLGFLNKDQRKIYDRALFLMINEMIEEGFIKREKFEKNVYKLTRDGKKMFEKEDRVFAAKRDTKKIANEEALKFFDSVEKR